MSNYVIENDDLFECKVAITMYMNDLRDAAFKAAENNDRTEFNSLMSQRDKLAELREKLYSLEYAK
jgi:hypothetical protein